jgi:AcrR family transcriptional regulator
MFGAKQGGVARRGDQLREHILFVAKDVFLEMGFERASMDAIAERAQTSKRTLYAHFENKEKLYLAGIELVRKAFLNKIKRPGDYSDDPADALTMFCARFLQMLLFAPVVRMCRLSIAEVDRFPEGSARYFDVIFTQPHERLAAYLKQTFRLSSKVSSKAADDLLGRLIYPRFQRALFGLEEPSSEFHEEQLSANIDLRPIRKIVAELIESLR